MQKYEGASIIYDLQVIAKLAEYTFYVSSVSHEFTLEVLPKIPFIFVPPPPVEPTPEPEPPIIEETEPVVVFTPVFVPPPKKGPVIDEAA